MPTDWIWEFTHPSFQTFEAEKIMAEESRLQESFGVFNSSQSFRKSRGAPPSLVEEEEPLYEPLDTSFDLFI